MTLRGSPVPVDTWQYRIGLRNPVSSSIWVTSATITPLMSYPACSNVSTSRPAAVSRRATSPGSGSGSPSAAYSASQDSGTRIRPPSRMPG